MVSGSRSSGRTARARPAGPWPRPPRRIFAGLRPLVGPSRLVDEGRLPGSSEPGDGRAEDARLDDMVASAGLRRAVPHAHPQLHARDHRAVGPEPLDVWSSLCPGVAARLIDDIGPPRDLAVTRPPAGLPSGLPVVMTRPDRDAEHEPDRYPARHDQLGEILPGQVRGERRGLLTHLTVPRPERSTVPRHTGPSPNLAPHASQRRPPAGPDRSPERRELLPAEQKRPPRHSKPHHSVPAELSALSRHPLHRRPPGLIHGPHQRPQRPVVVSLTPLTNAFRQLAGGRTSIASRDDAEILGQLYPSPYATPKTAAPNTWPTGSKPTLRIAANSPEVSDDPHVPLARIPAIRAAAAAGSSSPITQSYPRIQPGVPPRLAAS